MKNIISIFVLILSIISCSGGNSGNTKQTENTQTNQTQTNEQVYINPTTTNTNEYVQVTKMYPMHSQTFFLAVQYNNIKEVKSYLDKGANPNAQDEYGFTALMYAALMGYDDIAKLLIEEGTDVNIKDNAGATALMYAARDTNYEMV
ncbi:ankyrin repeat domain-containing protein, partial [Brachyspira pilosicoli]|nr:ankyrin repeat domain-containing protein [Brachyspira pilosicoli]